jgi:hypothetical protein
MAQKQDKKIMSIIAPKASVGKRGAGDTRKSKVRYGDRK